MPSIQVRDLPNHIYLALKTEAEKQRRSLSQQIIVSLAKALEINADLKTKRIKLLDQINEEAATYKTAQDQDFVSWLREDRDSR